MIGASAAPRACRRAARWAAWLGRCRLQPYRVLVTTLAVCFVCLQLKVLAKFTVNIFYNPCDDQRYGVLSPWQQASLNHSLGRFEADRFSDLKAVFQPRQQGYLVMGIVATGVSSIRKDSQLLRTVESIMAATSKDDQRSMTIVVFLASFDRNINEDMFNTLLINCSMHIRSGMLQIVQLDRERLHHSVTNSWLATQRMMAAIFHYIYQMNQGEQYIHLKEGMYASYSFVNHVKTFVDYYNSVKPRVNMVVGHLADDELFGTVYSVKDLGPLAQYLTLFPSDQPLVKTMAMFMQSKTQYKKYKYHRNLFSGVSKPVISLLGCLGYYFIMNLFLSVIKIHEY